MTEKAPEVIKNLFKAQQAVILSDVPMTRKESLDLQNSTMEIAKEYRFEVDPIIQKKAKDRYFITHYHSQIYNGNFRGVKKYFYTNGGYVSNEYIIDDLKRKENLSYPEVTNMAEVSEDDYNELSMEQEKYMQKVLDKKDMKKRFFVISGSEQKGINNPLECYEKTVTTNGKYINYSLHIKSGYISSIRELSESDYNDYISKSAGSES